MPGSSHIAMAGGAEFDIIRGMEARWGPLATGLGDDAAVIELPRGERLIASTDATVEDVHFRRGWLTWREIGYRAVTAALSDLAAMAASPLGVLVSLSLPKQEIGFVNEIADGVGEAVAAAGTVIRGGNLAESDRVVIATTVLGSVMTPLTRAGARPGDHVYVTGRLGGPSAALNAFRLGQTPRDVHRGRFAHPSARIAEARWLASRGASAAIDISDGLPQDLAHLAMASNVVMEVSAAALPLIDGVDDGDAFGGEEYELILTSPSPLPESAFAERFGIPLTCIGTVREGASAARIQPRDASGTAATPRSWDHFAG